MADIVEEFLSNYPDQVQSIIRELRGIVRKAMSKSHESLYYDAINYSISDSPLDRICYISPVRGRATLGFLFGAKLDDRYHLLQGIGKRARHIKVRTLEEARNPALKELAKAAWADGANSVARMKQTIRERRAVRRQRAAARSRSRRVPRSRRKRR